MKPVDGVQNTSPAIVAAPAPVPGEEMAERRELIRAVEALNAAGLFGQNSELTFMLDRDTRRPVLRIVDRQTNEVIRQIPPEYILRMAEDLKKHPANSAL